jgi:xylan 1,4-beta-xylosidase
MRFPGLLPWLSLALAGAINVIAQSQTAQVTVSFTNRLGLLEMHKMALGQGGLSEEPMWDHRIAEIRALKPGVIRLFIQEYFDLLPEPGRYHFDTLDRSVATIQATGAKPVMCICFKPRSLFPEINHDIVEPTDYAEWEKLVYNLVRHYRERGAGIRYWEIANEPDIGESGGCPYRFKPDSYTRYYRHTAAAILRADPEARVGGPALAGVKSPILPALLRFCDTNQAPLHFISWHLYSSNPRAIRDTVDYAKGLLAEHPALHPETFLDEWNMDLMNPPLDPRFQPCYIAETVWQMKDAGLDYSCYYHIRDWHVDFDRFAKFMSRDGVVFMTRWWNRMPQFDGLFDYQDTPRPAYFAFKLLSRLAGERLQLASDHPAVHGFAAYDPQLRMFNVMLWNFSTQALAVDLTFMDLPRDLRVRHLTLDAASGSNDENIRLRPDPPQPVAKGAHWRKAEFGPYGVQFWMLE